MNWLDIIILVALVVIFLGGVMDSLRKTLASFAALMVAIPLAGAVYRVPSWFLSLLPGRNWEHFLGFGIAFGLAVLALTVVFRFLLGTGARRGWAHGILDRTVGGVIGTFSGAIGILLISIVIVAYPVLGLRTHLLNSQVVATLAHNLTFVSAMLPDVLRNAAKALAAGI